MIGDSLVDCLYWVYCLYRGCLYRGFIGIVNSDLTCRYKPFFYSVNAKLSTSNISSVCPGKYVKVLLQLAPLLEGWRWTCVGRVTIVCVGGVVVAGCGSYGVRDLVEKEKRE